MALKIGPPASFPFLSPQSLPSPHRPPTEIRLSRWNNANAEPFIRRRRTQEQIERDIRLHRRYQSIDNLTQSPPESPASSSSAAAAEFKSAGTPLSPSSPSIPGRRSKYSKPPPESSANPNPRIANHPAFKRPPRPRFVRDPDDPDNGIAVTDRGIAYRLKDAPFEFQYSYTETPKVRPLALREQPFLPFGPETTPRPWTGRKPLPESKKKMREFDSFNPPPPGKKGVKPVQSPGPFLMGSGPKYTAMTREEVLGEPLSEEEVRDLVKGCLRTKRQLNMGRDGFTHNMLENIHAHWKRRRVCKIKCKGVCTVDMDNVRQQLEEKTGGKIIYSKGGVIFLFRGRNYNYKTRPRFPLMLWKPVTPVYPKLVPRVPEGLTLEEATEMRKKGRELPPICTLGKNGVYTNLVMNVKEAFEACELVRVNCEGMNKSDIRKIGAKLKDLVPCILISFEYEHILMWRGRDWKSSLPQPEDRTKVVKFIADNTTTTPSARTTEFNAQESRALNLESKELVSSVSDGNLTGTEDVHGVVLDLSNVEQLGDTLILTSQEKYSAGTGESSHEEQNSAVPHLGISLIESSHSEEVKDLPHLSHVNPAKVDEIEGNEVQIMSPTDSLNCNRSLMPQRENLNAVELLLRQAIDTGCALILDDDPLDANTVYEKSAALAKTAPAGPVFQHRIKKVRQTEKGKTETEKLESDKVHDVEIVTVIVPEKRSNGRSIKSGKREDLKQVFSEIVPRGSLGVDELAKLLA